MQRCSVFKGMYWFLGKRCLDVMGDILSSQYLINPECIGASLTKDVIVS
jgi:hypothetical protein